MVGSALMRVLKKHGYDNIVTRERSELDLLSQSEVAKFFSSERPEYVFLAAGKTGGVYANNTARADFIYENLVLDCNLIQQSFLNEVRKLVYFGCSSMYPKLSPQPMKEEYLLTGPLEPTNEPFAVAKIAGWKLCESYSRQYGADFITIIPTSLYGINQSYAPLNCLLVPALIQRVHEAKVAKAKSVTLWGSGRPSRDFLFVDDLANAALFLMNNYSDITPINVGSGRDHTVREVAELVCETVGFKGEIEFDTSMPDGVLMKLQDISNISTLGWKPTVDFRTGLKVSYEDFLKRSASGDRLA